MKLNLGCGTKKLVGFINCDIDESVLPDKIVDLNLPLPFENNSIEEIELDNVLEHLHIPLIRFFSELQRILKRNGTVHIVIPNFFRWKSRLNFFLIGKLLDADGWEFNHSILIGYWDLQMLLRQFGFAVPTKSLSDVLFEPEINIVIRKREDKI